MKISIVGTGNVAHALGMAFISAGHKITGVYGRDKKKTQELSKKCLCKAVSTLSILFSKPVDLCLIAVNDDAIGDIIKQAGKSKNLIVHTSGSVDMQTLSNSHSRCGVFYPLQTFSPDSEIDFKTMPICIETTLEKDLKILLQLSHSVSGNVYLMDSKQRMQVHLAAVIANNFSNHLYVLAGRILEANHLSFDLLRPIILTSAKNLQHKSPAESQTGPAKRNNVKIMRKHLVLLKNNPSWQQLYELISNSISAKS